MYSSLQEDNIQWALSLPSSFVVDIVWVCIQESVDGAYCPKGHSSVNEQVESGNLLQIIVRWPRGCLFISDLVLAILEEHRTNNILRCQYWHIKDIILCEV